MKNWLFWGLFLLSSGGMVFTAAQESRPDAAGQLNPPAAEKGNTEATESFEKLLQRELERGETPQTQQPSWAWQVFKTTFVLGLLIAVLYAIYRLYIFKQKLPGTRATALKIHYEYPLAQGKMLQIVELGNRLLVLGLSEAGINLITEISDRGQMEKIILDCEKDKAQEKPDFFLELSRALSRRTAELLKGNRGSGMGSQFSENQAADTWDAWRSATIARLEKIKQEKDRLREKG